MSTLSINSYSINKVSKSNVKYPVVAILDNSETSSGIIGTKLIKSTTELDIYFPMIKSRDSIKTLIDNGCNILVGRLYKEGENFSKRTSTNFDTTYLSEKDNLANININLDNDKLISYYNYLFDQTNIEDIINSNYSIDTINKLANKKFPRIPVIESIARNINRTKTYSVIFDFNKVKSGENYSCYFEDNKGNKFVISVTEKDEAPSTTTSFSKINFLNSDYNKFDDIIGQISNKVTELGIYNIIDGKRIILLYNSPVNLYNYSIDNSIIAILDNVYNTNRLLIDNFTNDDLGQVAEKQISICSKLPGEYYNNITVSIDFPSYDTVVIYVTLFSYTESHFGGLDVSKSDFIENVVNENSNLISINWNAIKFDSLMGETSSILINRSDLRDTINGTYQLLGAYNSLELESINFGDQVTTYNKLFRKIRSSNHFPYLLVNEIPDTEFNISLYEFIKKNNLLVVTNCIDVNSLPNDIRGFVTSHTINIGDYSLDTVNDNKGWVPLVQLVENNYFLGNLNYISNGQYTSESLTNYLTSIKTLDKDNTAVYKILFKKITTHLTIKVTESITLLSENFINEQIIKYIESYYKGLISSLILNNFTKRYNQINMSFTITSERLFIQDVKVNLNFNV